MAVFLDSGSLEEAERFLSMGIIRGVTTNPTILSRGGITGGGAALEARAKALAGLISPFPLFVEVTTNDPAAMALQARTFAGWAPNIVVKIPVHGPDGELENFEVVHRLETREGIRVNMTAMMSAQQCLLGALAGATYVSLFGGRIGDMGYEAAGEIRRARTVLEGQGLTSRIIAGSIREPLNVVLWLEAGAHDVTVPPDLLRRMIVHPYSRDTIRMFLADAAKTDKQP
jgi:transaldolase